VIQKKNKKYSLTTKEKLSIKKEKCYLCSECQQSCPICFYDSRSIIQFTCDNKHHRHVYCGCTTQMIRDAATRGETDIPDFRIVDANQLQYSGFNFAQYLCKNCGKEFKVINQLLCSYCFLLFIKIFAVVLFDLYALLAMPIFSAIFLAAGENVELSYLNKFLLMWPSLIASILALRGWKSIKMVEFQRLQGTYFRWVPVRLINRIIIRFPILMTVVVLFGTYLFYISVPHFATVGIILIISWNLVLFFLFEINAYFTSYC